MKTTRRITNITTTLRINRTNYKHTDRTSLTDIPHEPKNFHKDVTYTAGKMNEENEG